MRKRLGYLCLRVKKEFPVNGLNKGQEANKVRDGSLVSYLSHPFFSQALIDMLQGHSKLHTWRYILVRLLQMSATKTGILFGNPVHRSVGRGAECV